MCKMNTKRKQARSWLNNASKTEFDNFVEEAMFNDFEKAICYARRRGQTNIAIAINLHCDVSTVDRAVTKIYRMANKLVL